MHEVKVRKLRRRCSENEFTLPVSYKVSAGCLNNTKKFLLQDLHNYCSVPLHLNLKYISIQIQMFPSVQSNKCEMATTVTEIKRNILLLGRTGVGKSSVVNHIIGRKLFLVGDSTTNVTSTTRMAQAVLSLPTIKCNLHLQVIDTAGFYYNELTDPKVIQDFETFLKSNVPEGVHLILHCVKFGRLMPDFTTFSYKGQDISDISALVITHCETFSAEQREMIISELTTHQTTKDIVEFMKKGVVCVGFPSLDEVDDRIRELYRQSAQKDTEKLRALIEESNNIRQCSIM